MAFDTQIIVFIIWNFPRQIKQSDVLFVDDKPVDVLRYNLFWDILYEQRLGLSAPLLSGAHI
jgi:hypothetical protein